MAVEDLPRGTTRGDDATGIRCAERQGLASRPSASRPQPADLPSLPSLPSLLRRARADERRRIGRELHDRVAQAVTVVLRNLELCELYERHDPERAARKRDAAAAAAHVALTTTKELCNELRGNLDEPLEASLSHHLRLVADSRVDARVSVSGNEWALPPPVRDELFLIVREAAHNAAAHSGAGRITIELTVYEDRVEASVGDDGLWAPPQQSLASGGTGLASMGERVGLLGGTLTVTIDRAKGTRVDVTLPLAGRDG